MGDKSRLKKIRVPNSYFSFSYRLFRILGVGWWRRPTENHLSTFHAYFKIYQALIFCCILSYIALKTFSALIMYKNKKFMFNLASLAINYSMFVKLILAFIIYTENFQRIARTIEVDMRRYYQNYRIIRSTVRVCQIITYSYYMMIMTTLGNITVTAAMRGFKSQNYHISDNVSIPNRPLMQNIYVPYNYQDNITYIITYAVVFLFSAWVANFCASLDSFIATLLIHISGQFNIVQEAFQTVYERTLLDLQYKYNAETIVDEYKNRIDIYEESAYDEMNSLEVEVKRRFTTKQIEEAISNNIKSCIEQHSCLIKCVLEINDIFASGFFCQVVSSSAAICAMLLQMGSDFSELNITQTSASITYCLSSLAQIALICFPANEVSAAAIRVSEGVWLSRWERFNVAQRRNLSIVLRQAQKPLRFTAGIFTINIACFLATVKAGYTYYTVIMQRRKSLT